MALGMLSHKVLYLQIFNEDTTVSWDAFLLGSATLNITVPVHGMQSSLNLMNDSTPSLMHSGGKLQHNNNPSSMCTYHTNISSVIEGPTV